MSFFLRALRVSVVKPLRPEAFGQGVGPGHDEEVASGAGVHRRADLLDVLSPVDESIISVCVKSPRSGSPMAVAETE